MMIQNCGKNKKKVLKALKMLKVPKAKRENNSKYFRHSILQALKKG